MKNENVNLFFPFINAALSSDFKFFKCSGREMEYSVGLSVDENHLGRKNIFL